MKILNCPYEYEFEFRIFKWVELVRPKTWKRPFAQAYISFKWWLAQTICMHVAHQIQQSLWTSNQDCTHGNVFCLAGAESSVLSFLCVVLLQFLILLNFFFFLSFNCFVLGVKKLFLHVLRITLLLIHKMVLNSLGLNLIPS